MSKAILLAEDEEHIAKLVAFKLGKEGFEVTIAPNGQEAVNQLGDRPWGLIILDVMMPILDGWQVLAAIRSNAEFAQIPVLMLTAKGQKDLANAVQLGAQEYLKKPFDPGELAQVVKKLVKGSG